MSSYIIKKIDKTNIEEMEFAYTDFLMSAQRHYGFEISPLSFQDFKELSILGAINTIALFENNILKSFLIYNIVIDVAEITLIHTFGRDTNIIDKKKALIKAFLEEPEIKKCKLASYSMMGKQVDFVKEIAMFGFEFVGQSIINFSLEPNSISKQIFQKVAPTISLPEGMSVCNWDAKYSRQIVDLIHSAFFDMQDKKFDPRFATKEGCEDILSKITDNIYGDFLPQHTKILLQNSTPVGFCLVNLTTPNIANIPLIGILPNLKFKKLGQALIKEVLIDIIKSTEQGILPLSEINATTDTDNLPAINIYRKTGFKESTHYPQAYSNL